MRGGTVKNGAFAVSCDLIPGVARQSGSQRHCRRCNAEEHFGRLLSAAAWEPRPVGEHEEETLPKMESSLKDAA